MIKLSSIRNYSSWVVLGYDLLAVICAWLLAYAIRFDLHFPLVITRIAIKTLPIVCMAHLGAYYFYKTYRPLWRFSSLPEILRLMKAVFLGCCISFFGLGITYHLTGVPRSLWIIYPLVLVTILCLGRLIIRLINFQKFYGDAEAIPTLIIGAGKGGELFLRDFAYWRNQHYKPLALLDDNLALKGKELHGVRIFGSTEMISQVATAYNISLIIIAIPSINSKSLKILLKKCESVSATVRILPSLEEITAGKVSISDLRDISLEDLLGREPISLDKSILQHFIHNKVVLVTGGGGSIGMELCRQIVKYQPKKLVIVDHTEFNLYRIEMELRELGLAQIQTYLASITDEIAMQEIFSSCCPQLVFHAAAYKHVPMLEYQARQAVQNNVIGTHIVAKTAIQHHVEKFILVSTDKAVNPTNVMGRTKRIAEMICQSYKHNTSVFTQFSVVRFGNVIGSAGSVIPLFKEQLARGGPITVTHPDMVRYFMTIPEASQLVLQAGAMGENADIFVLDMGDPVKIAHLAKQLIALSGKKGVDIVYTGLRPGEKLYEELFYQNETLVPTKQRKIFRAISHNAPNSDAEISLIIKNLIQRVSQHDEAVLQKMIAALVQQDAQKHFSALV